MKIRKVKNSAGNIAIQVGYYKAKSFKLQKHIGTAKTNKELARLTALAKEYIDHFKPSLVQSAPKPQALDTRFTPLGYRRNKAYKYFKDVYEQIFPGLKNQIVLRDLIIIRLINPTSKVESLRLLAKYFDITYSYTTMIRRIKKLDKETFTSELITYAQIEEKSTLFYDVTTLYFYSDEDENLRKPGYSKDGKFRYPQILFGLVVDKNGFPVYYDVFKGNTFEGHTIVPLIKQLKDKLNLRRMVVVADAGMLSEDNILALVREDIDYIVGGRRTKSFFSKFRKNIKKAKINKGNVSKVNLNDDSYLLVSYSAKRYRKDMYEINKAVNKANLSIRSGSYKRRSKFINIKNEAVTLNQDQIVRSKELAGIKVYRTNLKAKSQLIINRYKDLWKVERSFRISKSDLKTRPIYHRDEIAIRAHIQICVGALAITRLVEHKENKSIRKIVSKLMDEIEVQMHDNLTNTVVSFPVLPHSFG